MTIFENSESRFPANRCSPAVIWGLHQLGSATPPSIGGLVVGSIHLRNIDVVRTVSVVNRVES